MKSLFIVLHFADGPESLLTPPQPAAMVELFYKDKVFARALYESFLKVEEDFRTKHGAEIILRGRRYSLIAESGRIFGEGRSL